MPSWLYGSRLLLLLFIVVSGAMVYFPGISGPYLFDDYPNFIRNQFVKIDTLDWDSLYHAAYSLNAGPLQRPVAMITFALNYYFAGGFHDSAPFKLTNLAIHLLNGVLVFWLAHLVLDRSIALHDWHRIADKTDHKRITLIAAGISLLWTVHPIQLSSVLYVVQRMTSLSALFTLLAVICYIKWRPRNNDSPRRHAAFLLLPSVVIFGWLGTLSKENALLLPFFILALECTLFQGESPWRDWKHLAPATQRTLLIALGVVTITAAIASVNYALPGYGGRPFTLIERVMTESRVLFFYLSLILVPQIHRFGLHHDDIPVSTSLLTPWTTLPSTIALATLLAIAVLTRKSRPLLSLGLLWFFSGHLLESTIFPLEIAHEHRNYLAILGILLIIVYLIHLTSIRLGYQKLWLVLPLLALFFGGTTYLRASQWATHNTLFARELLHHPDSAVAHYQFGILLTDLKRHEEAEQVLARGAQLEPSETSHLVWLQLVHTLRLGEPDANVQSEIIRRLSGGRLTPSLTLALDHIASCLANTCRQMSYPIEAWMQAVLSRADKGSDPSYYYYLLGISLANQDRVADAIDAFRQSHEFDRRYLHPLFGLAAIYLQIGRVDNAEQILFAIRDINKNHPNPQNHQAEVLAQDIERTKANR